MSGHYPGRQILEFSFFNGLVRSRVDEFSRLVIPTILQDPDAACYKSSQKWSPIEQRSRHEFIDV